MSTPDRYGADLAQILLARRVPVTSAPGPQEAVIQSVSGSGTATTCYFTVPALSATVKYGPAPCPAGIAPGQRGLVLFVGAGIGDPWIVAVTDLPKPSGF